jgi:hypothetical protein
MHHHIDPVEPAFEELLIGLELERVRHDTRGIREHAILADDGITFDATRTGHGNHFPTGLKSHWDVGKESLAAEENVAKISRRHDVHPNQLHAWRRQARLGLLSRPSETEQGCRFAPVVVASDAIRLRDGKSTIGAPRLVLSWVSKRYWSNHALIDQRKSV